jgi:chromosome partitioning protein
MLTQKKLFNALPETEIKAGQLAGLLDVNDSGKILEVARRLERKNLVRIRKPFLRAPRILKIAGQYPMGACKVLGVLNLKGGVGKTITSVNLAAALAQSGHKTLLADLDPQANATSLLEIKTKKTIYQTLVSGEGVEDAVNATKYPQLDFIASQLDLAGAEAELLSLGADGISRLKDVIEAVKDDYSYVILDCPPSLSILTLNALMAADSVIVPTQCDRFSLESIEGLGKAMELMRKHNAGLHIEGVLLTDYNPLSESCVEIGQKIREKFRDNLFDTIIHHDGKVMEAAGKGMPVIHYSGQSQVAKAYMSLAREVIENGK